MPAPTNLGFETPGAGAGEAASWVLTPVATYEEIAAYGAALAPYETFEGGWSNDAFLFAFDELVNLNRAVYEDVPPAVRNQEGFENYVPGLLLLTELTSAEAAAFDTEAFENFENGWANDVYLTAFGGGDLDGVQVTETFNTGWDNDAYLTAFGGGDLSAASYDVDGTPEAVEDFEEVLAERRYTADPDLDVLYTDGAHGFADGQKLTLESDGGRQAVPLQELTTYYARFPSAALLNVSFSPVGSPIDITSNATGVVLVVPDRTRYWTTRMATL